MRPSAGFDNTDRERVREAADIVRVIGEHIALKPKGREYVGICPFHDDHSPSMGVVPHKQIFKCHSCGAGGDVYTFVQRYLNMDFREALEYLAEKFQIKLQPQKSFAFRAAHDTQTDSAPVSRSDLLAATSTAAEFFRVILGHAEHGAAGRQVIARRGISPLMQEQFMLGVSPARWDGLLLTLRAKHMSEAVFAEAGLLKRRDDGSGYYDAFRNRVMFPIQDKAGRVVAFGARKIDDQDEPKYLNSAESRIFKKSSTLYGLALAARSIQRERTALITEGYMDTIACHQAGFTNAVATLGTALTTEHADELRRLCETVVLVFDGDQAGQRASDRAVEVFFAQPIDVRICTLASVTDAKDPDELLKREGGADVFRRAIAASTDLLEYRFARIRERVADAGTSALARAIEEEIARLVDLGLAELSPVRQALVIRRLGERARLDESVIRAAIPAGRGARPRRFEKDTAAVRRSVLASGALTAREHAIGCVLCDPALWLAVPDPLRPVIGADHREPAISAVAEAVAAIAAEGGSPDLRAVMGRLDEDPVAVEAAVNLAQRVEEETEHKPDRLRAHWGECMRRLEQDALRNPAAPHEERQDAKIDVTVLEQQLKRIRERGPDARVFPRKS
ncbi:MAG: DNA primase [Phycisphaerales bacterium]|nr:DNA primase [Phycisphaerales bacterium]